MFQKLELTRMAQALATHSGARLGTIARNVANADTPGYRAQDAVDFASSYRADDFRLKATRPGHLGRVIGATPVAVQAAGGAMQPNGNDVSLDLQMMKAVEARQSHEMALAVYRSTSAILRTSLGRNA